MSSAGRSRSISQRLTQARLSNETIVLTKPYLDIVRAFNPKGELKSYPGSPLITRGLMRPQDRLVACEIEPKARKALINVLRHDEQARVVDLDGWMALPAFVPPKERRGLVLIDPSFEAKDEFERLSEAFSAAFAKWPTGIYVIWYPAKSRRATDALVQSVARLAAAAKPPGKCLRLEFSVAPQVAGRVEERLDRHEHPDGISGLQGGRFRPGERSELCQANWSPTAR